MNKLAIIHFQPLELYPPVQNLLQFLEPYLSETELEVYSNSTDSPYTYFVSNLPNIKIIRIGRTFNRMGALTRYYNYLLFNIICFIKLIKLNPKKILYYETISSCPAFLYRKYFNSKVEVLIHYHEYTSPEEYKSGMKLVKFFRTRFNGQRIKILNW